MWLTNPCFSAQSRSTESDYLLSPSPSKSFFLFDCMRTQYHRPVLYRQRALEFTYTSTKRKRIKCCSASSRHRYSSVSSRTNDSSPTITRTVTPIPLEFSELPDPFVPKDEWAVVNVSGQRFHINMEHVKLHHPKTLLGSSGSQILKILVF